MNKTDTISVLIELIFWWGDRKYTRKTFSRLAKNAKKKNEVGREIGSVQGSYAHLDQADRKGGPDKMI